MTRRSVRVSTTHGIPDHPVVTLEDLKHQLSLIDHVIVPVYSAPDPRQPPVGRVVSGIIVELGNGEYALDVDVELFDPEFIPDREPSGDKRVALLNRPLGRFGIRCDTISMDPKAMGILMEISDLLDTRLSLWNGTGTSRDGFFTVIIGVGGLSFGYITGSLHRRLGRQKVREIAVKLARVYEIPRNNQPDPLLIFDLDVTDRQQRALLIEVILTNPSREDIESLCTGGLGELDRILPPYYLSRLEPKKIVIHYNEGRFRVLYAVEEHGVPMIPRSATFTAEW
jgi:hypothetical protein